MLLKSVQGLAALLLALVSTHVHASPCDTDDHSIRVTGQNECLIMRKYGSDAPKTMLVWLHGDVSSGGPANYHFRDAEKAAQAFKAFSTLSVALVRPGYPDGTWRSSTVAEGHGGRRDHYTKVNIAEIASAIDKLKSHYQPEKTILIGHSGGASIAAVVIGWFPQLAQAAVLVSCPCDLAAWRAGRQAWSASEDPAKWVDAIQPTTEVVALTGDGDTNTPPALAERYVERLGQRGVHASFHLIRNTPHNGALESPEVMAALERVLTRWQQAPSQ